MAFAIIPCRMGSERFYGKPLALINGIPMYWHVYNTVKKCLFVSGVVVATEDWEIVKDCTRRNVPCVGSLKGIWPTGSDRVFQASRKLGIKSGLVFNVQGDEPLITHGHIKELIDLFDDPAVMVGTLVRKLNHDEARDEDVVKAQFDGTMRIFNFSRIMPEPGVYYGSIGIMGFRVGALADFARMEQSKWEKHENIELQRLIDNDYPVHCAVTDVPTIGVDRIEDIKKVEEVLNAQDNCRSMCN